MKVQTLIMQAYKEDPVVMIFSIKKSVRQICKIALAETGYLERIAEIGGFDMPTTIEELGETLSVDITLTTEEVY